jgi:transposase
VKTPPAITSPFAPDLGQVRAWLEKMVAALKFVELVTAILALIGRMCAINAELTKRLAHLQRKRPRSETLDRVGRQLALPLPGLGLVTTPPAPPPQDENADKGKRSRKGKHPGRAAAPAHIERVEVLNPVPAAQRICTLCGAEMTTVGHSRCEILNVIPAKVFVEVRLDERVACPKDDTIVSAPTPPAIVERGKLGDELIVESLCDKYLEHMPIERQCTRFARYGVDVAPATLGRGVSAAIDLLAPVARLLEEQTRAPGLLGTDATGIPVLDPETRDGIRSGTIWCWTNARWVRFVYSPSGDAGSVRRFLGQNLARTVQCDGTNITTFIERAGGKRPGCWAHGRRRLVEAARSGDQIALEGLRIISRLFAVERTSTLAGDNADQRRARRQQHTRPVLDELRAWVDAQRAVIPPKTPLGAGLGYLHRQWQRLVLFLDDGNIEATNNRRERELRRLVLGRRNWLFTWLDVGGERTADILSIVATCIAHDVNPRAYLHVVTRLIVQGWPKAKLRELLPDRMLASHPEIYVGEPLALSTPPATRSLGA